MKVGIIGAGIAGLSAAYDLLDAGHDVTLFEASETTGGLARGFQDEAWAWPLEHFYHHIFETDDDIINLTRELGIGDTLFFPTPRTSMFHEGKIYPFSNPVDWWKFPTFDPLSYVRFGVVGAFLRYTKFWKYLEKYTAADWTRRFYGKKIYDLMWKPLLIGKFGDHYKNVNMAWLWARLHVRSFKLGYFEGGFQHFIDRLTEAVTNRGGAILLQSPVSCVEPQADGTLVVTANGARTTFDKVLHTTSPALLAKIAPSLPPSYLAQLQKLDSMGAVVMTFALKQSLLTDGTYWLNLPAISADKAQNPIPFLAIVEHTNYIDREHYGGDHIIYAGDYVNPDHPYMTMDEDELADIFLAAFSKFNPAFDRSWIRKRYLFRASYAQPVPLVNHSENIPAMQTPVQNLYLASMSQVYPWDRGTNFAVQIGRKAANEMQKENLQ